jgi:hypothetical protein
MIHRTAHLFLLSFLLSTPGLAKGKSHHHKSALTEDHEPWACAKNGKIIKVKGKNDREKQDHCEAAFGIWQKKRHALESSKKHK